MPCLCNRWCRCRCATVLIRSLAVMFIIFSFISSLPPSKRLEDRHLLANGYNIDLGINCCLIVQSYVFQYYQCSNSSYHNIYSLYLQIVTTWRSGSTFLGDLLMTPQATFYHYEPLLPYVAGDFETRMKLEQWKLSTN